ncbi:tubulin-specific chaperone D-like protein [Corchorus olitorius]|uniref:Tubulin-specific chaperone D-like protein n=1 Tax=Corchorus olitorius TaxID=93759 RepID=A0A1R3K9I7_9ROSI|nr:tubulin-specific chaperone D-like protein [Corchorus olitorius]
METMVEERSYAPGGKPPVNHGWQLYCSASLQVWPLAPAPSSKLHLVSSSLHQAPPVLHLFGLTQLMESYEIHSQVGQNPSHQQKKLDEGMTRSSRSRPTSVAPCSWGGRSKAHPIISWGGRSKAHPIIPGEEEDPR